MSCEDCATGYTRSTEGLYLGLCQPCQCFGHASICHTETGVCIVSIFTNFISMSVWLFKKNYVATICPFCHELF